MHKVSYVLAIRFSKDLEETYFYKKHPPDAWKDDQKIYDFGLSNTFWNELAFKPIQQVV